MKRSIEVMVAILLLALGVVVSADVFNLGSGLTSLETVKVGNPGNAADYAKYGSVSYTYSIGKYEVTAGQYTAFLNAVAKTETYGLYNTSMADGWGCRIQRSGASGNYTYSVALDCANRPVNYVSFWDACRFANWLSNGQPTGVQDAATTERGAYNLDGYNGSNGRTIQRNTNWKWAVTSENEWHKGAYYKGGGTNAGYWLYPTQSDSAPSSDITNPDGGNNANYNLVDSPIDYPYYTTEVGEFQHSKSAYGTFDQGGNVWEWTDTSNTYQYLTDYDQRVELGGCFASPCSEMKSSLENYLEPSREWSMTGFRVSQAVPEPSSIIALAAGFVSLLGPRKRKV